MLEYDIDEAQALLEKNLSTASRNLETLVDDLDFLRDQFTTVEVSILSQLVELFDVGQVVVVFVVGGGGGVGGFCFPSAVAVSP